MSKLFTKNNKNTLFVFIVMCLLVLSTSTAYAQKQTKKDLENKKKQLQKEIENTNQLLAETKKNKKLSLNQLVILNKKISAREELIATINNEIYILNKNLQQSKE